MRIISNEELLAISGGQSFWEWLSSFFSSNPAPSPGHTDDTEIQTVTVTAKRYSSMTPAEQSALNLAYQIEILQAANPGCTTTASVTENGGALVVTVGATATGPTISVSGSAVGQSSTTGVICPPKGTYQP